MTDAEWAVPAPPVGQTAPRRHQRDPLRHPHKGVWRVQPADFPPRKTVHDYHTRWAADGTLNRIHNTLREQVRTAEGRDPDPSAALVDSQSVKAAESVTAASHGYDAANYLESSRAPSRDAVTTMLSR
jgi:putative transposase